MLYAILSDIHANADALRAVLTDAADAQAERIVCLGDVLGYGPDPVAALELVYRRAHVCLAGNHDDAVSGRFSVEDFTDVASAAVARHRAALTQKAVDWLRHLPHTCAFAGADGAPEGAFACAHGDFANPGRFDYILEPADALPSWAARAEPLLFVGHTHQPGVFVLGASGTPHRLEPVDFTLEPGKRYIVNVGSVGYPRSGVCRSFYCLYDDQARTVCFRSLPFDLDGYRAKMHGQGLDEAPWMSARARERRRPEVRGAAAFGRAVARKGGARRGTARARPSSAALCSPQPAAERPTRAGLGPALVLVAVILALAGTYCTVQLVRAAPPGRVAVPALVEAPPGAPPLPDAGADARFAAPQPLSGGWAVALERPGRQRVRIDANSRRNEMVFRIESEEAGTVRFVKTLPLSARPARVYYAVNLLTAAKPGERLPFRFTARIAFFDAQRRLVGEEAHSGKRSASNRSVAVPPTAETAEMRLDCTCSGVHDLAVPSFRAEPPRAASRPRRK